MNTEEVKIISLWQPWASLIALGLKQYETRSWSTSYRGRLAIHATQKTCCLADLRDLGLISQRSASPTLVQAQIEQALEPYIKQGFPYGCIVAVADLTQCSQMTSLPAVNPPWHQISLNRTCSELSALEIAVGDWQPGRYAWKLENVQPLAQPIPFRGSQGLRTIQDTAVLRALKKQSEEMINA